MGCSTMPMGQRFVEKYEVNGFTINVADWRTIKEEYRRVISEKTKNPALNYTIVLYSMSAISPMGFCDPCRRIMWVMGDESDLPSFYVLGHETWHFPELGGLFFHGHIVMFPF